MGRRYRVWIFAVALCCATTAAAASSTLRVYAGLALRPPLTQITAAYEKQTGARVELVIGEPAALAAQMAQDKTGDVFVPGSEYCMRLAEAKGVVAKGRHPIIAYLEPCIAVARDNSKHIESLSDLARPGVRVGIRDNSEGPEKPCLGEVASSVFRKAGLLARIEPNIAVRASRCDEVPVALRSGKVDAVICWTFFTHRFAGEIAAIALPPRSFEYRPIPAAVAAYASDPSSAQKFIRFLGSPAAKAIFERNGYPRA